MARDWIELDSKIRRTTFKLQGGCSRSDGEYSDMQINVHRRGTWEHCLSYPAIKVKNNLVTFEWDEKLYELKPGWYVLELQFGDCQSCGMHAMRIGKQCWSEWISSDERSFCLDPKPTVEETEEGCETQYHSFYIKH